MFSGGQGHSPRLIYILPADRLFPAKIPAKRSSGLTPKCLRHFPAPAEKPFAKVIVAPDLTRHPDKSPPPPLQTRQPAAQAYLFRRSSLRHDPAADGPPSTIFVR